MYIVIIYYYLKAVELSTFITCDNNVSNNKHFYGHMEIHTYNTYSILNKDLLIMLSLYKCGHLYIQMYMM